MKFSIVKTKVFLFLVMMLFSVLFVSSIDAQSGTSGIRGTVVDQNGAAVPGATVKLTNPATGFNRSATTDTDGKFNFASIPPSTYKIEVEAANFKKSVNSSVQALVDLPIEISFQLVPGDVSAIVDITSNNIESVVNTQDASLGNNFVPQQIIQLPADLR